jgi:ABC-type spermidine/putrescine transport system permease subunit II
MDARLEHAADLRGDVAQTIWRVVLLLSLPAILSAAVLVLTCALEEFAIPGCSVHRQAFIR